MPVRVTVHPIPPWMDGERLLGDGPWEVEGPRWSAGLERPAAADLIARLRGLGFGGKPLEVEVQPRLKPALIRAAKTRDARARRDTTPGFAKTRTKTDAEGRWSLTPEALAVKIAEEWRGATVIDATCGAGGNAIAFARAGCSVTAIDVHRGRLDLARHNARTYQVDSQIRFLLGDARTLLSDMDADLVFVDPPWSTDWNRTLTGLDDLPLLRPLLAAIPKGAHWIAKVPPSFDPAVLPQTTPTAWFGVADGDRHRVKFLTLTHRAER